MSERETLTWERLKITPRQQERAQAASRLVIAANMMLEIGQIDRSRHAEILKSIAPDFKPVVGALNQHFVRKAHEAATKRDG